MEKQVITFKADEQGLIKTGGITNYASNTVSYIEATFVLGANWTGFDSVRAIWSNDYRKVKSTVLNGSGVCIVPAEILTRTGKVTVNLVGSVVENDTVSDRLTTYPITAVVVDANARLDNDEPGVTPTQFEQFVAIVKDDADRAETAAGNADTSAEQAEGYADDAEGYMQRAETAAETAETEVGKIIHLTASAETLSPGSQATASYDYDSGTLTLGIPQGATGATPNITIGSVTTLEPGSPATATITGTAENPVLNLGIPKGAKGDTGVGIESIYETGTSGAVHTYTILYTNGNTTEFTVTDGQVTNAALQAITGDLANLTTTDKTNLVAAINELVGKIKDVTTSTKLKKLVTGNPIVVDDALGEVKSLSVELEPIQDLHGYSKPWAAGAGVNKFNASTMVDTGIVLQDDGSLYVANNNSIYDKHAWEANGYTGQIAITYRVKYGDPNKATGAFPFIKYTDGTSKSIAVTVSTSYADFTLVSDSTKIVDYVSFTYGTGSNPTTFYLQIELGNTASSWTPYSNICPITGRTQTGVHNSKHNLFFGEYGELYPLHLEKGTDVVVSCVNTSNTYTRINYYDVNKVLVDYFTLNQSAGNNRWYRQFKASQYDAQAAPYYFEFAGHEATDMMIELGTQLTDFEQHTDTVQLPHTVYGGNVNVTGGEGEEKWFSVTIDQNADLGGFYTGETNVNRITWIPYGGIGATNSPIISDRLETVTTPSNTPWSIGYNTTGSPRAFIYVPKTITSLDEFITYVTSNPIQLVYKIATATDLDTTPTDVELYNGDNVVSGDGDMDMTYVRDIAIVINKIEAQL